MKDFIVCVTRNSHGKTHIRFYDNDLNGVRRQIKEALCGIDTHWDEIYTKLEDCTCAQCVYFMKEIIYGNNS